MMLESKVLYGLFLNFVKILNVEEIRFLKEIGFLQFAYGRIIFLEFP
jgi:hypothetical protein